MKAQVRARLLDTLLDGLVLPPLQLQNETLRLDQEDVERHNKVVRAALKGAKCIEASNVARYFIDTYVKPAATVANFMSDLKALVPPYRNFFIEWEPRVTLPGEGENANRLHEARGHLKDYRRGKGLFGKYKGLWYWGSSLAGSGEEGVIVSDYKVEASTTNDSQRDPKGDIGVSAK